MINISLKDNKNLYEDYLEALTFLKDLNSTNFQYPSKITNFHLYSEVTSKKQLLAVKSFFATQNLSQTKLILWSDYDVSKSEILKPFANFIDFKIFDPMELSKGTPLEGLNDIILAKDGRHYMQSGLLRFLALYKMGGIWFDMDMVLLRDLKPILDQEFAYVWGCNYDDFTFHPISGYKSGPCAAFMGILKESEHALICLEELKKAPIIPNSVSRDCDMLAKVYKQRPFTIFPSAFFNTEWQMNRKYPGLGDKIQNGWFKKTEYSTNLFLEAFAWHWHNGGGTGFGNLPIEKGSKFDLLNDYVDNKLKIQGI